MGKLRVNLNFDKDWMIKNSYDAEEASPMELIVGSVTNANKARIISADYTTLIVEMEESSWDEFADWMESFAREYYDEDDIWKYVQIEGGKKGWEPKQKTEEEEKQQTRQDKRKQLKETLSNAGAFEDNLFAEIAELAAGEEDSEKEKSEEEIWQGKKRLAESKLTSLLREHEVFTDCPPLKEYVEHIKNMALTMMKMNAVDSLWNKKLLLSMDSGFGFSTFVISVFEMLEACGITERSRSPRNLGEYRIQKGKDGNPEVWDKAVKTLQLLEESICDGKTAPGVIAIDITEWEEDLNKPEIQGYLRQIAENTGHILCIFRVQLLEEAKVRELEQYIGKAMPVQSLIAYSPSIEKMAEYLCGQLEQKGFSVFERKWENWDLSCDSEQFAQWNSRKPLNLLEQWVNEERRNPLFSGYRSLDNMADRLIYKKAENNVRKGEYSTEITIDDMQDILDITEETENPWEELDSLIGMQSVKDQIKSMVVQLKGIKNPEARPSLHMKFVGNPGTGKTTIARIVAKILDYENLLTRGRYIEIHARDFCTEHVGGTNIRTRQYCRDAYGSVLFVDEAYSLYSDKDSRDPGREAIAVLVKQMEDHVNDMCVIMAGYQDEMKQLETMNAGLKGRMREIKFPNYSREELVDIFFRYLRKDEIRMDITYEEEALRKAVGLFFTDGESENLPKLPKGEVPKLPESKRTARDFSNARFVRNLYEAARGEAICRKGINGEEVLELTVEDFKTAAEQFAEAEEEVKKRIGF